MKTKSTLYYCTPFLSLTASISPVAAGLKKITATQNLANNSPYNTKHLKTLLLKQKNDLILTVNSAEDTIYFPCLQFNNKSPPL